MTGRSLQLVVFVVVELLLLLYAGPERAAGQEEGGSLPQSDVQPLVSNMVEQGFTVAAAVAQSVQTLIPIRSTLLLPTNDAIATLNANFSQADVVQTLQYHVLAFPASFRALSRKSVGSELPTLLQGAFITVTGNSTRNMTLNNVNITHPDVCSSTKFVACHGIDRVLMFDGSLATAPQPVAAATSPSDSPSPSEESADVPGPTDPTSPPNTTANSANRNSNSHSGVFHHHSFANVVLLAVLGSVAAIWLV